MAVKKVKFSTYFDKESWIKDNGTENKMESLTDQSFKCDCEITDILVRYGGAPRTPVREPVYDLENYKTSSWTFEDWQNEKAKIERKFLHLDKATREMFGTPQKFFEYCSNPNNYVIEKGELKDKPKEVLTAEPVKTAETITAAEVKTETIK